PLLYTLSLHDALPIFLIVDDHEIVRAGMRMLLESEPDIEVIGEANNGKEAIEFIEQHPVDIIIMDVSMPEMTGVEATQFIKTKRSEEHTSELQSRENL